MHIDNIILLPKKITTTNNLTAEFQELLNTSEAKSYKRIVYFFLSEKPISRVKGESNILYIGKTTESLNKRYFRYAKNLASNRSGEFYKHIINSYGGLSLGLITAENPKNIEAMYFKKYYDCYLEYPPKSKVG